MKKQSFKNLVSLAQQEEVPSVNIADRVISIVNNVPQTQTDPYRAYTWFGVASAAIAACIVIAATMLYQPHNDSVSELISYVSWVNQ